MKRRRRSYRAMILVSAVLLSFVFATLILNEARITEQLADSFGGIHHVVFLSVDGAAAKGISEHEGVDQCVIIPVIANMESSVDVTTVGKVAVLTEEIEQFMQIHLIKGEKPTDDTILIPRNLYSDHSFLLFGEAQDMYFESSHLIYRSMAVGGIYTSTDKESPYIFVNQSTGEDLKAGTGHNVTFDVYLTLKLVNEFNAAKIAKELISKYNIQPTAEQQTYPDNSDQRAIYRDYINTATASYRDRYGFDQNKIASIGGVVIAAIIMADFLKTYTARHISEYGILATHGAKRRHLHGIVVGQAIFVTLIALLPVLLLSFGGAYLYQHLYNEARAASNLPVLVSVPVRELLSYALWYLLLLCFLCVMTMQRMFSQLPFPMIRGNTAQKIPFVRRSSRFLDRAKDKIRYISWLQSLRLFKSSLLLSLATSVICLVCAFIFGLHVLNLQSLNTTASSLGTHTFDGVMESVDGGSVQDGFWRGFPSVADVDALASVDGVKTVGGIRERICVMENGQLISGMGTFEILVDQAHAQISTYAENMFRYASSASAEDFTSEEMEEYEAILRYGVMTPFTPYYCDQAMLPYLYSDVIEGDPNDIYTTPNSLIFVDNGNHSAGYHVGDTLVVNAEATDYAELTVVAVVTGRYFVDLSLPINDGCVILSPETGEQMDGFPKDLRTDVFFLLDDALSDEACADLCESLAEDSRWLRYDTTFYETERLHITKLEALENGVTVLFFAMLYFAMCVLDYYHARESTYAQRQQFCVYRQFGATNGSIYNTTRTSVYIGQCLAVGFTFLFALIALFIATEYYNDLANMCREYCSGPVLAEMLAMVREMQNTAYAAIGGLVLISLALHGLAILTAILGTVLPTKRILKENIAAAIKGDAEV